MEQNASHRDFRSPGHGREGKGDAVVGGRSMVGKEQLCGACIVVLLKSLHLRRQPR